MASESSLRERLEALPPIQMALADESVDFVTITPGGRWSLEKYGRLQHGGELPVPLVEALVRTLEAADGPAYVTSWKFSLLAGGRGPLVVAERCPTIEHHPPYPSRAIEIIRGQIEGRGHGLVVGAAGSGKLDLLCWLMLQFDDEYVVLVSEHPPRELEHPRNLHVFPPDTDAKRRQLSRTLRRMPVVIWDRLERSADLRVAAARAPESVRWFALDAPSVEAGRERLGRLSRDSAALRLDTIVHVTGRGRALPEIRSVMVRDEEGDWDRAYGARARDDENTALMPRERVGPPSGGAREGSGELTNPLHDSSTTTTQVQATRRDALEARQRREEPSPPEAISAPGRDAAAHDEPGTARDDRGPMLDEATREHIDISRLSDSVVQQVRGGPSRRRRDRHVRPGEPTAVGPLEESANPQTREMNFDDDELPAHEPGDHLDDEETSPETQTRRLGEESSVVDDLFAHFEDLDDAEALPDWEDASFERELPDDETLAAASSHIEELDEEFDGEVDEHTQPRHVMDVTEEKRLTDALERLRDRLGASDS